MELIALRKVGVVPYSRGESLDPLRKLVSWGLARAACLKPDSFELKGVLS